MVSRLIATHAALRRRRWRLALATGVAFQVMALVAGGAMAAGAKPASDVPTVAVAVTKYRGDPRFVFQWRRNVDYEIVEDGQEWRVRFDHRARIDAKRLAQRAKAFSPRILDDANGTTIILRLPEDKRLRPARSGVSIVLDVVPRPPRPKEAQPTQAEASAAGAAAAQPSHAAPTAGLPLHYAALPDGGAALRLDWGKTVAAAAWHRGGRLWLLFDTPTPIDLGEVRAGGRALVPAIEQVANARATVIRLSVADGYGAAFSRQGNTWTLELKRQVPAIEAPIPVEVEPMAKPPRVGFAMREPAAALPVADPELGDTVLVLPTAEPGQGLLRPQSYVDFQALPSLHGLVLRSNVEGLAVRATRERVEVTLADGLVLSDDGDRVLRAAGGRPSRLFDFASWSGPSGSYLDRRRALEQAIVAAPAKSRTAPRLALARFYFSEGFGAETIGVLEAIRRDDSATADEPRFHALYGAASFLAGDRETAARELRTRALLAEPEAALWRGAIAAESGDWGEAAKFFTTGAALLPLYPKRLRHRFALLAAEAALIAGPREAATSRLDLVLNDAPEPAERAQARFLQAKRLRLAGDIEGAIAIWSELAKGEDRPTRARAAFERTNALLESGRMARGEALEVLDGLRYAWRGGDFEIALLRRIAELRLQDGDWSGGFAALRQVVAHFPDHPAGREVQQQLAQGIVDLFKSAEADKLPPLKALALYEEHRDLVPAGAQGNEIIRRLVDRLVAVDLLDRAATLLDEQVRQRLAGVEKAQGAVRLARIRLLDHKPDAALAALDIEVAKDLPAELAGERQRLRARALAGLGRTDEALAAITGDSGREAAVLRAGILWKAQKWPEAAKAFAGIAASPDADGTVDDETSRIVLKWATALTLADDREGLAALRQKYAAAMEKGPNRDAFRVIAAEAPAGGDVRAAAANLAQIDDLQSFMAGDKQRVTGEKPSRVN